MEHYHPYTVDLMINSRLAALREEALRERMLAEVRTQAGKQNRLLGVRQFFQRALASAFPGSLQPVDSRRRHEVSKI